MASKREKEQLLRELRGIRRIVINSCHGGFGLSDAAQQRYKQLCGLTEADDSDFYDGDIPRDDPYLVQVVQEMGAKANGRFARLKIVEIPADVTWQIQEYDGSEWVSEQHRIWK